MEFLSRLSLRTETADAVYDLSVDLKSFQPDLAMVFVSHHYGPVFNELIENIYSRINARILVGCTAESVIGPTSEIERRPAVALWLAKLPGVKVMPFVLDHDDLQSLEDADTLYERVGVGPDETPSFILLPEPFSINAEGCIEVLEAGYPETTIVGGMASGAMQAGQNRLFLNDQSLRRGLVGVALSGDVEMKALLAPGCRPVGEPFVITKSRDNLIEELGGRPALNVLKKVYNDATENDQDLMRQGLHLGRLIDEHQRTFRPGDFLVRNMMGVTEERALAVADFLRPGQTVQFHVKDSTSADEEMQRMLRDEIERDAGPLRGALMFSCNGRGRSFFKQPNHDIALVNEVLGDCPTAGFFAQGEIGPVGGKTCIHGYTSSMVLFREPGTVSEGTD